MKMAAFWPTAPQSLLVDFEEKRFLWLIGWIRTNLRTVPTTLNQTRNKKIKIVQ
jgi:hypothetical protein